MASTIADPWVQWLGPQNFALHAWACGDLDRAIRYQQEALAVARATDDRIDESISLGAFAGITLSQGDYARAQALAEHARRVAQAAGEEWAECLAVLRLGLLALQRGDHALAKVDLELSLKIARPGDPFYVALALEGLGQVAMAEGQHEEAHARLAESLRLLDEIGNRPCIADTLESFAALAARQSRPKAALELAGAAAALREAIGVQRSPLRRDLLDRWLPALQMGVGEDVCARTWAAGQAMTMEQATALSLGMHESVALLPEREKEVLPQVAGLTSREAEVLRLVASGQSNKEIATELVLSVRTVERHITNLYGKIDARGKADATAYAFKHGLL